ncbi:MAG TPA: tetratricopeptide repeat protein, partial [Nannocystaceae bacterium]|nr:tetratricopeptide repeat protein [Nannocystaceae bacterium]
APRRAGIVTAAALGVGVLAWSAMPRSEPPEATPETVVERDAIDRVSAGSAHAFRSASALAQRAGDTPLARTLADTAVGSAERSGDSAALVSALVARAKLENAANEEAAAIVDLERAHALARRDRHDREAARVAIMVARVFASRPQNGDDAQTWLRQAEASAPLDAVQAARIASTRGRIAIADGALDTAAAEADRALALLAGREVDPAEQVDVLLSAHADLMRRGDRREAGELFDDLVEIWCIVGRCDRSSIASRRMLDELVAELGADDDDVAYARVRLAFHLFATAAFDDAQRELETVVAMLERNPSRQPVVLAIAVQRLSHLHTAAGRIPIALEYGRRAATLVEQAFGRESPNFVTAMLQLATVESAAGEVADARRHLEWALIGSEQALGPSHPLTAVVLTQLATLARVRGDHARARSASLRAMAVHEAHGAASPDYVNAIGAFAWSIAPDDPMTAATLLRRQIVLLAEMRASVGNPTVLVRETREAETTLAEVQQRLDGRRSAPIR